jgi:hypothetical protein
MPRYDGGGQMVKPVLLEFFLHARRSENAEIYEKELRIKPVTPVSRASTFDQFIPLIMTGRKQHKINDKITIAISCPLVPRV